MNYNIKSNEITIRTTLQPGDIGYITYLHGLLYYKEYNYNINCEVYIAEGLCEFYNNYDPQKDCAWIAEHNKKIVGCVMQMHRENNAAQLRYFILDPVYRGIGLGKRLTDLFMDSLRKKGYEKAYLWTINSLSAAAHIYKKMGFVLTEEIDSYAFGVPIKEQRYDLTIRSHVANI
jgi:ribosomal protein S18 acetylase RimI-like enzyme